MDAPPSELISTNTHIYALPQKRFHLMLPPDLAKCLALWKYLTCACNSSLSNGVLAPCFGDVKESLRFLCGPAFGEPDR